MRPRMKDEELISAIRKNSDLDDVERIREAARGESFDLQEFYRRVAEMEGHGCSNQDARRHAKAVVAAVKSAVAPGEFDDLVSQLPSEYGELVSTGPVH
jgi:uncharacterized protein (DUF2267 family)